jgi:4'-phosphopantetheinyl transferase
MSNAYQIHKVSMNLHQHEIHIWSVELSINKQQEAELFSHLSSDECNRARQFKQDIHRRRFIAAHSALKFLLSVYLNVSLHEITFSYNSYKKPFVANPASSLQFNMAHSQDIAIIGLTLNHAIGIDIEKIRAAYNPAIANRYYSEEENKQLNQLTDQERTAFFYQLWASKEALVKAVGQGLSLNLSQISVHLNKEEMIHLENTNWRLYPLSLHTDFAAAVATNQTINTIISRTVCLRNNHWTTE